MNYIYGGDGLFAIYVMNGENDTMYYVHKDYHGSYDVITDEDGNVLERLSFDPWGRRRNATDWTFENVPANYLFDRGYTGHEHLDVFSLINMNGRAYDPWLGRFLSPDPLVQSPGYSQSYNRYSYCFNNPLKYSDPSGYNAWKFEENPIQTFSSGNPGIFRINWNTNYGSDMSTAGSYNYNWSTGQYYNSSGAVVSWNEVFVNYVQPNSICIYNASSSSFSNKRNRQGPQKNQQNNIKGNNLLANIRKAILDQGGMMFYGTLEQVITEDDPVATRPSFQNMIGNYPGLLSSSEVFELIGGKVYLNHLNNPEVYSNSCALRLSRALNYSGADIPYIKGQTGSGSDGKWYFYRVSDLADYVTSTYGSFDKNGDLGDLSGQKGIILFQNCGWSDATGHLDLWNGNNCLNHCYWEQCGNASLWILP